MTKKKQNNPRGKSKDGIRLKRTGPSQWKVYHSDKKEKRKPEKRRRLVHVGMGKWVLK